MGTPRLTCEDYTNVALSYKMSQQIFLKNLHKIRILKLFVKNIRQIERS